MRTPGRRWPVLALAGCTTFAVLSVAGATTIWAEDGNSIGSGYASNEVEGAPLQSALAELPADVRKFNDHLTFLADPFCAGRLPGTNGMEVAKQYMEYYLKQAGLEPAFDLVEKSDGGDERVTKFSSWRQPFPLGSTAKLINAEMSWAAAGASSVLTSDQDFKVLTYGGSGDIEGAAVFVGYSMNNEDEDYANYSDDTDLNGKIAVMFRFEPMNEEGGSQWNENGWSSRAGFHRKIQQAVDHGAAGVVIINPPNSVDPRSNSISSAGGGRSSFDIPVALMSTEAGEAFAAKAFGKSLLDLRGHADRGDATFEFNNTTIAINAQIDEKATLAENVGGILRGRGSLADEYIVIGGHLDHLGNGEFGSRRGAGNLHPGADDNASGSAGVLIIADKLAAAYAELPEDMPLRSIVLVGFSAEESGLNGSRYYTRNPIADLEKHVLMMNFDMIGRIKDKRLSVSGASTGVGMADFVQPMFDDSGLEVVVGGRTGGGSDHAVFYQKSVPVLFAIIADFHGDYHTPDDVSWKINRVDAVKACNLWVDIALESAKLEQFFPFDDGKNAAAGDGGGGGNENPRAQIKVRFGIVPGDYESTVGGVLVNDVTDDSSASNGGVKKGDRLVKWDGKDIKNIQEWMQFLAKHKPGDTVDVTVVRDDVEVVLKVKLQGRDG